MIHDAPDPQLTFPDIDVFSSDGHFLARVDSVARATQLALQEHSHASEKQTFAADSLSDIAVRFPELGLKPTALQGHPTILLIQAPGCHACELQERPLKTASLTAHGINQIILTLGIH